MQPVVRIAVQVHDGEDPDVIVGCVGGGSNFAGLAFPFLRSKIAGKKSYRVVAVEPDVCASLTKGVQL